MHNVRKAGNALQDKQWAGRDQMSGAGTPGNKTQRNPRYDFQRDSLPEQTTTDWIHSPPEGWESGMIFPKRSQTPSLLILSVWRCQSSKNSNLAARFFFLLLRLFSPFTSYSSPFVCVSQPPCVSVTVSRLTMDVQGRKTVALLCVVTIEKSAIAAFCLVME